jgi:hypothetical protein
LPSLNPFPSAPIDAPVLGEDKSLPFCPNEDVAESSAHNRTFQQVSELPALTKSRLQIGFTESTPTWFELSNLIQLIEQIDPVIAVL